MEIAFFTLITFIIGFALGFVCGPSQKKGQHKQVPYEKPLPSNE